MIQKLIVLGIFIVLFMMCWLSLFGMMDIWGK